MGCTFHHSRPVLAAVSRHTFRRDESLEASLRVINHSAPTPLTVADLQDRRTFLCLRQPIRQALPRWGLEYAKNHALVTGPHRFWGFVQQSCPLEAEFYRGKTNETTHECRAKCVYTPSKRWQLVPPRVDQPAASANRDPQLSGEDKLFSPRAVLI